MPVSRVLAFFFFFSGKQTLTGEVLTRFRGNYFIARLVAVVGNGILEKDHGIMEIFLGGEKNQGIFLEVL